MYECTLYGMCVCCLTVRCDLSPYFQLGAAAGGRFVDAPRVAANRDRAGWLSSRPACLPACLSVCLLTEHGHGRRRRRVARVVVGGRGWVVLPAVGIARHDNNNNNTTTTTTVQEEGARRGRCGASLGEVDSDEDSSTSERALTSEPWQRACNVRANRRASEPGWWEGQDDADKDELANRNARVRVVAVGGGKLGLSLQARTQTQTPEGTQIHLSLSPLSLATRRARRNRSLYVSKNASRTGPEAASNLATQAREAWCGFHHYPCYFA